MYEKYPMKELTPRQEEIVWSAIYLIDTKGIQGLTIKNLASSMKFTEAAIYRHFKSKVAILTAIIDLFQEQTSEIIAQKNQATEQSLTILKNTFFTFTRVFSDNPAIVSVIFAEEIFQYEEVLKDRLMDIIETMEHFFQQLILRGQRNGEIRNDIDATLAATSLLGTFRLTVKKWKLHGFQYSLHNETKRFLAYFDVLFA